MADAFWNYPSTDRPNYDGQGGGGDGGAAVRTGTAVTCPKMPTQIGDVQGGVAGVAGVGGVGGVGGGGGVPMLPSVVVPHPNPTPTPNPTPRCTVAVSGGA